MDGESLPQVEEFKYLGILFISYDKLEQEIDRRIEASSTAASVCYCELYLFIFIPTLTYGHEIWVATKRMRLQIQAAEISFLRRVAGLSLKEPAGALSGAGASADWKQPADLVRASH